MQQDLQYIIDALQYVLQNKAKFVQYYDLGDGDGYYNPLPRLVCSNGFSMSVQASKTHYCSPRDNDGPYNSVEIGYIDTVQPELAPFAEDGSDMTETVFPYVPIEIVAQVILNNGGFSAQKLLENHAED